MYFCSSIGINNFFKYQKIEVVRFVQFKCVFIFKINTTLNLKQIEL